MSGADATAARVAAAGGRLSPALALLQAVARAQLSRIPGPGDPELWARIADDDLADPVPGRVSPATRKAPRCSPAAAAAAAPLPRFALPTPPPGTCWPRRCAPRSSARPRGPHRPHPGRRHARSQPDPAGVGLTPREREVLALLGNGLSNARIAKTSTSAKRPPVSMSPTSCASSASPAACRLPPPPPSSSYEHGATLRDEGRRCGDYEIQALVHLAAMPDHGDGDRAGDVVHVVDDPVVTYPYPQPGPVALKGVTPAGRGSLARARIASRMAFLVPAVLGIGTCQRGQKVEIESSRATSRDAPGHRPSRCHRGESRNPSQADAAGVPAAPDPQNS